MWMWMVSIQNMEFLHIHLYTFKKIGIHCILPYFWKTDTICASQNLIRTWKKEQLPTWYISNNFICPAHLLVTIDSVLGPSPFLRLHHDCLHFKVFKVVICGKYKNLKKKSQNLTYLPEIWQTSNFCYSLQFTMQIRSTCCLKKCFDTERSKGIVVRENLKK